MKSAECLMYKVGKFWFQIIMVALLDNESSYIVKLLQLLLKDDDPGCPIRKYFRHGPAPE